MTDTCWLPTGLGEDQLRDWTLRLRAELARRLGDAARRAETLLGWARRYLPHHLRLPPSQMHVWLAERLDVLHDAHGQKINVIGPRGGAKSTLATLAYVLRAALEGWEPYIWIVSDTQHQACAHLENLKLELVDNRALQSDYPGGTGRGRVWRAGKIRLANGVSIEAYGTGQRIRGRRHGAHRPTLIVCDDVQNDSHTRSALQRELSRGWFQGTLLKAGTSRTNIVNLATALHRDALALELDRTPGWISRIFRAIEEWPTNMTLWHEWEQLYCDMSNSNAANSDAATAARSFYEEHRAAMEAGAVLLWPEHEDLYTLMQMRVEGGRTAFEREKQGSPINPETCEWPEEYFDERIWFETWPEHLAVKTIALDPSKGRDARRGDYSALVALGLDVEGLCYVEADLARRPTPQIVADGVELCRTFRPDAFGIEANQFQDLLGQDFVDEFRRQGLLAIQPWAIDNHVNKLVRIRRLGPLLAARRLRFKVDSPSTQLLVRQLREFPTADHDDGPDALEMALRLARELQGSSPRDDGLGSRLPVS